jgi:predicted O-methyltransferase YrrM
VTLVPVPDIERRRLFDALCESQEAFFGWNDEIAVNHQLSHEALTTIFERVMPGNRTLETGAGYSTIVFALAGANHTVVAPFATEQERIRAWCTDHGVDGSTVRYIVGRSQDVLPTLESTALDFVLVDGDHAFPTPLVDWYYSAERLRRGGLMMIDDVPLSTGALLDDFLRAEARATPSRWREVERTPRTVLYQKLTDNVLADEGWMSQPWCTERTPLERVRAHLRLRTRLRAVRARVDGPTRRASSRDAAVGSR